MSKEFTRFEMINLELQIQKVLLNYDWEILFKWMLNKTERERPESINTLKFVAHSLLREVVFTDAIIAQFRGLVVRNDNDGLRLEYDWEWAFNNPK